MRDVLPELCERIGVHLDYKDERLSFCAYLFKFEGQQQQKISNNPPASAPAAANVIVNSNATTSSRKMNTSSMFGVRYGTLPAAKQRKPSPALNQLASATTTRQSGSDLTEESNVFVAESTSPNMRIVEGNDEQKTTQVTAVDDYLSIMEKSDAALRMMIVECIWKGWPSVSNTLDGRDSSAVAEIVAWICVVMEREVWSVKKAAVQLLGVIGSSFSLVDQNAPLSTASQRYVYSTCRERILQVFKKGLEEQKYSQVRVESLKSLEKILKGVNSTFFTANEEVKSQIRSLIKVSSQDTQPSILEAAANLQNSWLQL